jgi:hypothetical protein
MSGRGGGFCRAAGRPGILAQAAGSLALTLLAWGGRALSRRVAGRDEAATPRFSLEPLPDRPAIAAGDREERLAEMSGRAAALEQELETLRGRIRQLESGEAR